MYQGPWPNKDKLQQDIESRKNDIKSFSEQQLWDNVQVLYLSLHGLTRLRHLTVLELASTPRQPPTDYRRARDVTDEDVLRNIPTVPLSRRHPME
jgi:hypothetical protein